MNKDYTIEAYQSGWKLCNLFVDDIRMPSEVAGYIVPLNLKNIYLKQEWVIVRSYHAFVQHILENGIPNMISFDHDLDGQIEAGKSAGIMTGYDCAKWLIDHIEKYHLPLPVILCHSMNPVGKENIQVLFQRYREYLSGKQK